MDYLKLALGLITLLTRFITYLREKELLKAGEAQAIAMQMRTAASEIARANRAREEAAKRNASVSNGSSLPDDQFRRD